jgi:polyhydroxybutyrate depolymerase
MWTGGGTATISPGDPCTSSFPTIRTGDKQCSLTVGGTARTYELRIPATYQTNNPILIEPASQGFDWVPMADSLGFVLIKSHALGGGTQWATFFNAVKYGGTQPDDAAYLRQVINDVGAMTHADPHRVYITGFSASGTHTHFIAVKLADLIAAAAVMEGAQSVLYLPDTETVPPPSAPVSMLLLHGDADSVVHYCGHTFPGLTTVASVQQAYDYWSKYDGCTQFSSNQPICNAFDGTPTAVDTLDASGCAAGTEVRFYRLKGGDHVPYTTPLNNPSGTPYNPNFNATTGITEQDVIWKFFMSHPKP